MILRDRRSCRPDGHSADGPTKCHICKCPVVAPIRGPPVMNLIDKIHAPQDSCYIFNLGDRVIERMRALMSLRAHAGGRAARLAIPALVLVISLTLLVLVSGHWRKESSPRAVETAEQLKRVNDILYLSPRQWAALKTEAALTHVFWTAVRTEGKIALNEDQSTPIFSPFAGRVTKLLAKPGDTVERGQPLFVIEAADMVQAQNDFMSAVSAVNKAKAALAYANIVEKQNRRLYDSGNAVALRDLQQAQAALDAAQNDLRSAEAALEAARNRLRILGRTDEEINSFQDTGVINPETPIHAPISGTVVQRRVGPGQYVSY
ncbi:MAG TPA: efflux RND transporter periplasmic adaptor subunit, partial [Xanthobacteraceae bacterium]|nr:efflux RND transporter periplasmic adaptor subunit [Xanthobacteraceae bacterium]